MKIVRSIIFVASVSILSCSNLELIEIPDSNCEIIEDKDGNKYSTVEFGNLCWLSENLKVEVKDSWCLIDDCNSFGRFYSWEAAQNACKCLGDNEEWRLPTDADWLNLEQIEFELSPMELYLFDTTGMEENERAFGLAQIKMGVNTVFNSAYAGYFERRNAGCFDEITANSCLIQYGINNGGSTKITYYWTSTESPLSNDRGVYRKINKDNGINRGELNKIVGVYVRCVK